MECPSCGTQNPDDAASCSQCSTGLTETSLPTVLSDDPDETLPGEMFTEQETLLDTESLPSFGSRYETRRLLGQGGMGAVYLARDLELNRDVALKEIRPELADQPEILKRFKREIQLSSEVTHPNVLRVFDLGEADGKQFLTMQYVEGEDLAGFLHRQGRLSLDETLSIFKQLCGALAAAHSKSVIHRDMKPENVMMTPEGAAFVTDFGLARSVQLSALTQTGSIMGTPHYMSPEQVKGEAVDAGTDVYALGVMLYEMLTGELPFSGGSSFEVMMRRVQRDPKPASEINPAIPDYLRRVLDRCLARDPAIRYSDAGEILADLEAERVETSLALEVRRHRTKIGMAVGAVMVILILALGIWMLRSRATPVEEEATSVSESGPATRLASVPAVGVLPLQNLTGNDELDWFGQGLARLVSDNLAQSRHVRVVSMDRMSTLVKSHDGQLSAADAAAQDIAYLFSGEILPATEGYMVTGRLTDAAAEREIVSERLEAVGTEELISGSEQLASAIRRGLEIPPTESVDIYAADFAAGNPQAYEFYDQGLSALSEYRYDAAEEALEEALDLAPDFTMARYRLAFTLAEMGRTDEALGLIQLALTEADRLPEREGRYIRAGEAYIDRRYSEAEEHYRGILESYPYETEARYFLAHTLSSMERYEDEIEELEILAELEPESASIWSMLGEAHLFLGELSLAITELQEYVRLQPDSPNGHHLLADAYRAQGELDLAASEYSKALEIDATFHYSTVSLAVVEFLSGRSTEASQRLQSLVDNEEAPPRNRIDGGFELSSILRSEQRFRDAEEVLRTLETLIAAEQVREAMSLSTRGTCWMEIGESESAGRLIDQSIRASPGVPTRYLFARGLLELRRGELPALEATALEILEGALPADDPDRTEDKAAAFLRGSALLAQGEVDGAIEELTRAVALEGYEYGVYRLGLARAFRAAGRLQEAMAAARQAATERDPADPRLDLELDRRRALLELAEVQLAMKRLDEAAAEASEVLEVWSEADPSLPDLVRARELVQAGN